MHKNCRVRYVAMQTFVSNNVPQFCLALVPLFLSIFIP